METAEKQYTADYIKSKGERIIKCLDRAFYFWQQAQLYREGSASHDQAVRSMEKWDRKVVEILKDHPREIAKQIYEDCSASAIHTCQDFEEFTEDLTFPGE